MILHCLGCGKASGDWRWNPGSDPICGDCARKPEKAEIRDFCAGMRRANVLTGDERRRRLAEASKLIDEATKNVSASGGGVYACHRCTKPCTHTTAEVWTFDNKSCVLVCHECLRIPGVREELTLGDDLPKPDYVPTRQESELPPGYFRGENGGIYYRGEIPVHPDCKVGQFLVAKDV